MKIHGNNIDEKSRCSHYHKNEDVVAIKFKCCESFYACYKCHEELEQHELERWEKEELNQELILCGNCKTLVKESEYLQSDQCLHCRHDFNPNCQQHYHHYFKL